MPYFTLMSLRSKAEHHVCLVWWTTEGVMKSRNGVIIDHYLESINSLLLFVSLSRRRVVREDTLTTAALGVSPHSQPCAFAETIN